VEFRHGLAESLPIEDRSVDVVISNGVINLCPDKTAVMQEVNRVLRPGGRVQIADIIVHKELPQDAKDDIDLWSGWIAGALLEAEWKWVLEHTGFEDIRWGREVDVFSGSKHESDAAEFETRGVTFSVRKAQKQPWSANGRKT
jgi:arsenite methyltransferase